MGKSENELLREAIYGACLALRAVGDDYPGSSCQTWCHAEAAKAWQAMGAWVNCPSTHCERSQECRSPSECSAASATLTKP